MRIVERTNGDDTEIGMDGTEMSVYDTKMDADDMKPTWDIDHHQLSHSLLHSLPLLSPPRWPSPHHHPI